MSHRFGGRTKPFGNYLDHAMATIHINQTTRTLHNTTEELVQEPSHFLCVDRVRMPSTTSTERWQVHNGGTRHADLRVVNGGRPAGVPRIGSARAPRRNGREQRPRRPLFMIRTALISLAIPAAAAAAVAPVAAISSDWMASAVFFAAALIYAATAFAAHRFLDSDSEPTSTTQLVTVALAWVTVAAACALLTWIGVRTSAGSAGAVELRDPMSSLFEAVSGASTTGLTMLEDPSSARPRLQWWRSLLQWFGAIGVVAFAASVAEPSGDQDSLVGAEWGAQPGGDNAETVRRLALVLIAITAASATALIASGDPVWRSVNHAMTAAATGGFAITEGSAATSQPGAQIIIAATLLISAISYGTIWDTAPNTGVPMWRRTQLRWGLAITAAGCIAALAVGLGYAPAGSTVFNSISAATTGGFAIGDSYTTVGALGAIAMASMFVGGAAGSTAGGIKTARVVWMAKAASRWVPGNSDVGDTKPYTWDGHDVEVADARHRIMGASSIAALWLATIVTATVILAVANRSTPLGDVCSRRSAPARGLGSRAVSPSIRPTPPPRAP